MNTVQRQFGKLMIKGSGDKAQVAVLLSDYEDADRTLTKIIEASKAWRDSWVSILSMQLETVSCFEELYNPIIGASDGHGPEPVLTSQEQLLRTHNLKEAYSELKTDLLEEVNMMDSRVIKPAMDAKDYLQPVRKTIKKRENKRLDYERYQDRVSHASKKLRRSDRENAALVKAEEDLAGAETAFKVADDHIREVLPPIIAAAFSILPHLLAAQIMIQNTVLAQSYTMLHNYCADNNFPSPSPPMDDVIALWRRDFKPAQKEVEAITFIARGKTVHQSMSVTLGDDNTLKKNTSNTTMPSTRNGISSRRSPSQSHTSSGYTTPNPDSRSMRIPSSTSLAIASSPAPSPSPSPSPAPSYHTPNSSYSSHSPAESNIDYLQRNSAIAQKKKPPPPPPKKFALNALYAVAQYAFDGQNDGDLSFHEGDQIRVLKKTDSTDDWWEGELRGVKGSFPANYCKLS